MFSHGAPKVYSFSSPPVSEEHGSSEEARGWACYYLYWGLGERPWEHAWDDHCITTDCGHVSSFTLSQGAFVVKNPPTCQCRRVRRLGFYPWVQKIPWRRARRPSPVFLPGESHGQRSLAGYSPGGHKESDTTWSDLAHIHIIKAKFDSKISGQQVCHAHHIHQ